MKNIDFRVKYFLILYPSLSRLAIWLERIAVRVEIVSSSLTTYNIFFKKKNSFFIINHDLHDILQDLRVKVNVTKFTLKVSNGAKIRNRYNQVPHLTQDTNGKVTNSQKTPQTRAKRLALSQQVTTKHI